MEFIKLLDIVERKILNYKPLDEIYYVDRHNNPFSEVVGLVDSIKNNWRRICDNFVNALKVLSSYIDKDDYLDNSESKINEDIFEINLISKDVYLEKYNFDMYREKIAKVTLLLNLYACCVVPQGNPQYIDNYDWLNNKANDGCFFRGEGDYNFSLLPSIYRKEKYGENGKTLNYGSFLFPYYHSRGLIHKYNEFQKYEEINYDFCSLMQHAECNSPFLDITEDARVALSFASNTDKAKKNLNSQ